MERGTVYPSWRMTADGKTTLVNNEAEDDALGPEWDVPEAHNGQVVDFDAPADPDVEVTPVKKKTRGRPKAHE